MIRKYTADDTDALIEIWDTADSAAHPFIPKSIKDNIREDMRNVYLPNAETWVLMCDGQLVGFIAMINTEIGGLFLDPSKHGKGLGRQMVDHVVALKGSLSVEVFKENKIGLPFYERYGFILTEESVFEPSGHVTLKMAMPDF